MWYKFLYIGIFAVLLPVLVVACENGGTPSSGPETGTPILPKPTTAPTSTPTLLSEPTPLPTGKPTLPSFTKVSDPPGGHISDISFAPSTPDVLYLASNVNAMGVWKSLDAGDTWHRVFYDQNFGATHTNTLAIHPGNAGTVLAGDLHGRIVKTSDGGARWRTVHEQKSAVFALAYSPSNPDTAYAGDAEGHLLKSLNGGDDWDTLGQVGEQGIGSLAVDPGNSDTVYAGAREGVYSSTDGGLGWTRVFPEEGQAIEVVEVTVAPAKPDLLFAATRQGVFRTSDGGKSWRQSLEHHSHSVQVTPSNPKRVYAGTTNGVYRSDDGGITWSRYYGGIQHLDIGPLTVHPEDPDVVLVGSNIWEWTYHHDPFPGSTSGEGIYKTLDGGQSWSKKTGGFVDVDVMDLAVDPNNPDLVYVGMECSRGIFRTDDGGDSWTFLPGGPQPFGSSDIAHYTMRLTTDQRSNLYMTGRFGFTRSDNLGQAWAPMLVRRHFHGVGISPHDPELLFAGTSPRQDPTESSDYPGGRILRSTDNGLSWHEAGNGFPAGVDSSVNDFAFDAIDPGIVYLATSTQEIGLPPTSTSVGIYRSSDGGQTWTPANRGLPRRAILGVLDVNSIAASPSTAGLLYAGTERGIFRSSNGGETWAPTGLNHSVRSLIIDPRDDDSVFAGTAKGLFWSPDGGSTWQRVSSVPAGRVTDLAMDSKGRVIYAAVNDVGIFKGVRY